MPSRPARTGSLRARCEGEAARPLLSVGVTSGCRASCVTFRQVISRTGDVCVVAFLDQWYLKYGEDEWKAIVENHVNSADFNAFNNTVLTDLNRAIGWLKEWACSRSFGLGTLLPWDKQFVIESLSDSTIYMAYYTIADQLQGDVPGTVPGSAGVRADQLTDEVFEYIFKRGAYPADCGIAEAALDKMRTAFEYWYPLDLRVSGKDLVFNHLTMSMYNHAAVWDGRKDRLPAAFFCNGHVQVDGEKMSKSKGNFLSLLEGIELWSADATRLALADAGDTLEDPNFERKTANDAVLWLTKEERWASEAVGLINDPRVTYTDDASATGIAEEVLRASICRAIEETRVSYESCVLRAVPAAVPHCLCVLILACACACACACWFGDYAACVGARA